MTTPDEVQMLANFLDSQDFYELMQAYRHTPTGAAKEYEAVRFALVATLHTQPTSAVEQEPAGYKLECARCKSPYRLITSSGRCFCGSAVYVTATQPPPVAGDAGWQPVESIPKTGDDFLCFTEIGNVKVETGHYMHHHMRSAKVDGDRGFYTHWQNLPPPPAAIAAGGKK